MNILLSLNVKIYIVVGIVCSFIVIGGLFLFLEIFVLKRRRCKKILNELDKKYEYLNSLLLGQDFNYIQRIEIISHSNLLYSEIYSNFFRKFKEIRDNQDISFKDILDQLKNYYDEKNYKLFRQTYNDNIERLKYYEDSVNNLDSELISIALPEEEARQNVLILRERFRDVKSKYNTKENELSYLHDSFYKVFEGIENEFKKYDSLIDCANYDETKEMVPILNKILANLLSMMEVAPRYIDEVLNVLPNKIEECNKKYYKLLNEGYHLKSLNIEDLIQNMKISLNSLDNNLKDLRFSGVEGKINLMHEQLDELDNSFSTEQESKLEFDENINKISNNFISLERDFIKISNNMTKIKKIYLVDEEHLTDFKELSAQVNFVSNDKRKMEVYIHQMDNIPYKALVNRMGELDKGTKILESKLNSFKSYVSSLKSDSENAFNLINDLYFKLKRYQSILRNEINDNEIIQTYNNKIEECYNFIDNIDGLLKVIPIDVNEINRLCLLLNESSNSLFDDINDILNYKENAEKSIVKANRERYKFADVNNLVEQAENLYFNNDYKRAYEISNEANEKIKLKDGYNK